MYICSGAEGWERRLGWVSCIHWWSPYRESLDWITSVVRTIRIVSASRAADAMDIPQNIYSLKYDHESVRHILVYTYTHWQWESERVCSSVCGYKSKCTIQMNMFYIIRTGVLPFAASVSKVKLTNSSRISGLAGTPSVQTYTDAYTHSLEHLSRRIHKVLKVIFGIINPRKKNDMKGYVANGYIPVNTLDCWRLFQDFVGKYYQSNQEESQLIDTVAVFLCHISNDAGYTCSIGVFKLLGQIPLVKINNIRGFKKLGNIFLWIWNLHMFSIKLL